MSAFTTSTAKHAASCRYALGHPVNTPMEDNLADKIISFGIAKTARLLKISSSLLYDIIDGKKRITDAKKKYISTFIKEGQ